MTSASAAGQAFAPRLDAEQALLRLLDLIEGSGSVAEITPERLRAVFDLPFTERSGRLGYAEQLTSEWWSSYELDAARALGPRFEFAFRPAQPETFPSAGDICKVDFARFAAALQAQGFRRETYRAEHGRVLYERFERGGLTVTVHPRGESDASPEKIAHSCVSMVHIH